MSTYKLKENKIIHKNTGNIIAYIDNKTQQIKYQNGYSKTKINSIFNKFCFMTTESSESKYSIQDIFDESKTSILFHNDQQINVFNKTTNQKIAEYKFNANRNAESGSYGEVTFFKITESFRSNIHKDAYDIVIKEDKGNINEHNVIKQMKQYFKQNNKTCNIILLREISDRPRWINKKVNFIYIMQATDGTLQNWLEKQCKMTTKLKQMDFIIKNIKEQMLCLLSVNKDFVYTDLKPTNIGVFYDDTYEISHDKKIRCSIKKVCLIDIGSVFKDNLNIYKGTLPCVTHSQGSFRLHNQQIKTKCIYIQLLFIIIFMLTYILPKWNSMSRVNISDFYYTNYMYVKNIQQLHSQYYIDRLQTYIKRVYEDLDILSKTYKSISFKESLNIINTLKKMDNIVNKPEIKLDKTKSR